MRFFLEIGLWIVVLNSALVYWASARSAPRDRKWRLLLLANAVLAAVLLATDKVDSVLAAISIGAFVSTVIIPTYLGSLTNKLAMTGRWSLALKLQTLRELLQPGRSWDNTKEQLRRLVRVDRGEVDQVLEEIRAKRAKGTPQEVVDAEVLWVLGAAGRWEEVVSYFEEHFEPEDVAILPGLGLQAVRAYGELGRYEEMRRIMSLLADSPAANTSEARQMMDMAGLAYLAYLGRHEDVAYLLRPASGFMPYLPEATRAYWLGIALHRAGKRDEAREFFLRAAKSSPRLARFAQKWLARQDEPSAPTEPDFVADHILVRLRILADQPRLWGGPIWRMAPATTALVLANTVAYVLLALTDGLVPSPPALLSAGALLKPATAAGQYWRILSAAFLHAHWAHFGLNMLVLAMVGRMAEAILGSLRFVIVYFLAAVVGGLATTYIGSAPVSVGASGAIFGIFGALVVVLKLGHPNWLPGWRRSLLGLTGAAAVLSLLPGVAMRVIDNWAHLGGLLGGAAAGLVLWRIPWDRRVLAGIVLLAILPALGYTLVQVLRRPPLPLVSFRIGDVVLHLPASWLRQDEKDGSLDLFDAATEARLVVDLRPIPREPGGLRMLLDVEVAEVEQEAPGAHIRIEHDGPALQPPNAPYPAETLRYRFQGRLIHHLVAVLPRDEKAVVVHLLCPHRSLAGCRRAFASIARQVSGVRSGRTVADTTGKPSEDTTPSGPAIEAAPRVRINGSSKRPDAGHVGIHGPP